MKSFWFQVSGFRFQKLITICDYLTIICENLWLFDLYQKLFITGSEFNGLQPETLFIRNSSKSNKKVHQTNAY